MDNAKPQALTRIPHTVDAFARSIDPLSDLDPRVLKKLGRVNMTPTPRAKTFQTTETICRPVQRSFFFT